MERRAPKVTGTSVDPVHPQKREGKSETGQAQEHDDVPPSPPKLKKKTSDEGTKKEKKPGMKSAP